MMRETTPMWQDLLRHTAGGDHVFQVYRDQDFLAHAVSEYVGAALRGGEAAVLVATSAHRGLFVRKFAADGLYPAEAMRRGQLVFLDAERALDEIAPGGRPDWHAFMRVVAAPLAGLRLQYPTVRAYGEMVDLLWAAGSHGAALELEGFWNELGTQQSFSLLCAYRLDNLDAGAYGGPLEGVCKAHTHMIPARDYGRFNHAVREASMEVLDQPLAQMLLSLSATHRPPTSMPLGQAMLFWLRKNMPRTAEKIFSRVRLRLATG